MMFAALLVPFGLFAVLLGMERLERWTVAESDDTEVAAVQPPAS
jgi:hypothetical protein